MESKNTKPDTSKATILVICMGFIVIYLAFHVKWALMVSLGVGVVAIASTFISQKIEWAWMKLSKILGFIVPNILLSIVFFIFLFPMALIARLFNKDPLMMSNKYKTYFVDINKQMEKKSFENIW
jgi:hypothetical protein